MRPRPEHLRLENDDRKTGEESSDEEAWFDYPCFLRQDTQFEVSQPVVNSNTRFGENVELEFGEPAEQTETPPRRESTRT